MDSTPVPNSNGTQDEQPEEITTEISTTTELPQIEGESTTRKRTRVTRPYPVQSFEDALQLAIAIQQHNSGKPVRRLTLFEALKKSPESSQNRDWVTSAYRYGLIRGSAQSDILELTEDGKIASGDEYSEYECTEARVQLAILRVAPFKALYDELASSRKFPERQFLVDLAKDKAIVPENLINEALDLFTVNAKFVGLLRVISGVERLITLEHLLELLSYEPPEPARETISISETGIADRPVAVPIAVPSQPKTAKTALDEVCFYISPIGEPTSEQRQHADLFLSYIIQPALEGTGLKVVRADKIDRPGIISSQIIRHLLRSRLVIADLSFHNPNVFYELAIRHASRLPTVHIVRASDPIPFDVNQMRTIKIDSTSIYTLIPQLDTYKAEIATQVRRALDGEDTTDNPISVFYPTFRVTID